MSEPGSTHDWTHAVDLDHIAWIRANPARYAPGGVRHLVLEVIAYAADEAATGNGCRCVVLYHDDGSISVADDGRGTQTSVDDAGHATRKPIMATRDLRFFDRPDAAQLPDGHPRHGVSVVAALSEWLVHTNRRADGAWTQRYEHGIPVTDLVPITGDGTTGTTVHFRPDGGHTARPGQLPDLAAWPYLSISVRAGR